MKIRPPTVAWYLSQNYTFMSLKRTRVACFGQVGSLGMLNFRAPKHHNAF